MTMIEFTEKTTEDDATEKNTKRTVYVIGGPTASGKSDVAYYLAKRIDGEILNCDSVQLYKYMEIGSAMPEKDMLAEVPHHLYAFVEPDYNYTVAEYQKAAFDAIDDVLSRGKTPIVVGGAGLYMNSLLYKMDFAAKPINLQRRTELEKLSQKHGSKYMFEYLSAIDPVSAARIHPNNTRKVVRAIEAFELGRQIKDIDACEPNDDYDFKLYGLNMDRKWLYDRINRRVIKLVREGLIDEVRNLMKMGLTEDNPSMKGIGYKEFIKYLEGNADLKESVYEVMKNTRRYAKRQITWLKRYDNLNWITIEKGETYGNVIDRILSVK